MGNSGADQVLALLDQMSVLVFIAAVLLIIYLITRFIRFANRSTRISHRALRNQLVQENTSMVTMPIGLERQVIEALPTFVYKPQQMKMVLDCAVCLWEFQNNEKGRVLPNCNHSFHIDCIDMWLFSHSTCPVCRTKIEGFSPGKRPELPASEDLRAVSGCGHGSKGQTSSSPADMDEAKPLPETAVGISV